MIEHCLLDQLASTADYYSPAPVYQNIIMVCLDEQLAPKYAAFRYCYQGDFRLEHAPHKKSPKHDASNNFYKGILQLLSCVPKLCAEVKKENISHSLNIIPVLVTNTKIRVYSASEETLVEIPWAIYDCMRITSNEVNPGNIKYVFVVSKENMPVFIEKMR